MKRLISCIFCHAVLINVIICQENKSIIGSDDFLFLGEITKAVFDSARIYPGDVISSLAGPNKSGGVLIRPGGRDDYPAFWIRDYAMSLESGFVRKEEQKHMLLLTAAAQCDQTWITKGGSMVPLGSIPDHIRIEDKLPVYFPGTYSYEEQGNKFYGMVPPLDDNFYFIHMAHYYVETTGDSRLLTKEVNGIKLIDRLEIAFKTIPAKQDNHIVYTTEDFRGVDYGFRDGIQITGDLCFTSILKFKASNQLAALYNKLQQKDKADLYKKIAGQLKKSIPEIFADKDGMLRASTGWSSQRDVWATALAVYFDIPEGDALTKACRVLTDAYLQGTLSYHGNIRHIASGDDYNGITAWEKTGVEKNRYQNGAFWGTPTGWVCYAISKVNKAAAKKLAKEFIDDLRENDFRKGPQFGAPYECFYPPTYKQNPLYLATVACPYIVFKSLL